MALALALALALGLAQITPGSCELYRGARAATMVTMVPRVQDRVRANVTSVCVRHPFFEASPPVWPTALTELTTVYLTLPETASVFEEAYTQCAMLCTLYNAAGGSPGCVAIQVETRACHGLTAGARLPGDTSDPAHVWCTFLDTGTAFARDVGRWQGTRALDPETAPQAAACMGFGVPMAGAACNDSSTRVSPSVAQVAFWRWSFSWTTRGWCVPLLPQVVAAALWDLTFSGACGVTGCGSWVSLVTAVGLDATQAWTDLVCTPRQTPLVPGACYCLEGMEAGGPTCVSLVPGCRGRDVVGAPSRVFNAWVTRGPPVATTATLPSPAFALVDGSWTGFGARGVTCGPGGCLDPSKEGPACTVQACAPQLGFLHLPRCGGVGVGTCTMHLQGGCECARDSGRDPVQACARCLSTHALVPTGTGTECVFVTSPCFGGTNDTMFPVSPAPACSGRGTCFGNEDGVHQCLCIPGWSGPLCDTPSSFTSSVVGAVATTTTFCSVASTLGASCSRAVWTSGGNQGSQSAPCVSRVVFLPGVSLRTPEAAQGMCVALGGAVATLGQLVAADTGDGRLQYVGWVKSDTLGTLQPSVSVSVGAPDTVGVTSLPVLPGVFCVAPRCGVAPAGVAIRGPQGKGFVVKQVPATGFGLLRSVLLVSIGGRAPVLDAACGAGSREQWLTPAPGNDTTAFMWDQFLWSATWLARTVFPLGRGASLGTLLGVTSQDTGLVVLVAMVDGVRVVWQVVDAHTATPTLTPLQVNVQTLTMDEVGKLLVPCSLPTATFEDLARVVPSVVVLDTVVAGTP